MTERWVDRGPYQKIVDGVSAGTGPADLTAGFDGLENMMADGRRQIIQKIRKASTTVAVLGGLALTGCGVPTPTKESQSGGQASFPTATETPRPTKTPTLASTETPVPRPKEPLRLIVGEGGGSGDLTPENFNKLQQEYGEMVKGFSDKVGAEIRAGRITGVKASEIFYKLTDMDVSGKAKAVEALAIKNKGLILIQEKEVSGVKTLVTRTLAEEGRGVEFCRNCQFRVPEFEIVTPEKVLEVNGPDVSEVVFKINNQPEFLIWVNEGASNVRQDEKGVVSGLLRIPVAGYLEVPAGMRLKQDAGYTLAGELQPDYTVKFLSTNPGIKTLYAIYDPIANKWLMNGPETIFETIPVPAKEILRLEGFELVYNEQTKVWNYVDVDGKMIAHWEAGKEGNHGRIRLAEGVTSLDLAKNAGIFVDISPIDAQKIFEATGKIILDLPKKGEIVERMGLVPILCLRNVSVGTQIRAPMNGKVVEMGKPKGVRQFRIADYEKNKGVAFFIPYEGNLPLSAKIGDELFVTGENISDQYSFGSFKDCQVIIGYSDADLNTGGSIKLDMLPTDEFGRIYRLK